MKRISKDYLAYLAVAYILLGAAMVAMSRMDAPLEALYPAILLVYGPASMYWGRYYLKRRETFDIVLTTNFFIRKRNHEMYDVQRMTRDLGKVMVALGAVCIVGGAASLLAVFAGRTDVVIAVMIVTWVVVMAVSVGFFVVCRRSKYLKNPSSSML